MICVDLDFLCKDRKTLTVLPSGVADSERRQVEKQLLELKCRQRWFKSYLTFMEPVKLQNRKHITYKGVYALQ